MNGKKQPTTQDLFRVLGKTQRVRSAKANNVFRQLRNAVNRDTSLIQNLQSTSSTNYSTRNNEAAYLAMKNASRPSNENH